MSKQLIIIGGGPAATHAAETIRKLDRESRVTMICDEPAHSRMALPYWLCGKIPPEQMHTGSADHFRQWNITWRGDVRATHLDTTKQKVTLSDESSIHFDELLLATGSRANALPVPGADLSGVLNLWTIRDAQHVLDIAATCSRPRVVLVGAGFIGLIVLNALHQRGWQLTVVEREAELLPRMLNAESATLVRQWLEHKQVAIHTSSSIRAMTQQSDGSKRVELADGTQLDADLVIVAIGVRPNLELVASTPIETDHGILVNDRMQTNVPGIYAAGDVAQGPVRHSNQREVHAIQPTAVDHGRIAGANMAGHPIEYPGSLSMNVLDVCGLQCCSFGRWEDSPEDAITICNAHSLIYRRLCWSDDQITGAIFVGRARDAGMLTDIGMVKGLIQTGARLGSWKGYLQQNPFDVRRAYVASRVPEQLARETLLGQPTTDRHFRRHDEIVRHVPGRSHALFLNRPAAP